MNAITPLLNHRLKSIGLEGRHREGYLRTLSRALTISPDASLTVVNQRLQYLGWQDVELDYHTLQLAMAHFEAEDGCRSDAVPCNW